PVCCARAPLANSEAAAAMPIAVERCMGTPKWLDELMSESAALQTACHAARARKCATARPHRARPCTALRACLLVESGAHARLVAERRADFVADARGPTADDVDEAPRRLRARGGHAVLRDLRRADALGRGDAVDPSSHFDAVTA